MAIKMSIFTANAAAIKIAKNKTAKDASSHELLSTSLLTVFGTVVLVGLHHGYRKRHQPEAKLQDYTAGIRTQLTRCHFASQQAKEAWQRAYHLPIDIKATGTYHATDISATGFHATDVSAMHSTTMLARPVCWVSGVASMPHHVSLTHDDEDNGFGVVGIDADRQLVWQTTMPERVHDIVVQPMAQRQDTAAHQHHSRHVVVMGRRPSERFWVLDTATGQVQHAIKASSNRHFYGHACYSLDGSQLYVTENDTLTLDGKIGIYDAHNGYQKVAEYDSYGIGPHELIMHPDDDTLVIANGGIKTEQASREELNLDSMQPSLVYLNRHTGQLLEQITPEYNQMSVRHLAIHDDGTVMIGIQFQGERHINVPLVLTHRRGDTEFKSLTMPNDQWQRFHQYIASVAVDSQHNQLCVTTPIGGCAAIFDLDTRALIDSVSLPDCAGASVYSSHLVNDETHDKASHKTNQAHESGFIVSDGQGQLTRLTVDNVSMSKSDSVTTRASIIKASRSHAMSFDNHLQALAT